MNTPDSPARYAGIDLAADPARTGVALLIDAYGHLRVEHAQLGADDSAIRELVETSDKAGVDVPFGWPRTFVEHVSAHASEKVRAPADSGVDWRRTMAMRRTDLAVRALIGVTPLSVSTDRIAYPALRWSALEAQLRERGLDCRRDGAGRVCEVYPAAALKVWGLPHRGYKKDAGRGVREGLVDKLAEQWNLDFGEHRAACVASDDVLDAVLAALVAREGAAGRTVGPADKERDDALVEGWIHVPVRA